MIFERKKFFEHKICVFFYTNLPETFLIRRRIGRLSEIWSKMCNCFHMNLEFSQRISPQKSPNIKFHEYPPGGSRVTTCGQTDRRTDTTSLITAFRNYSKSTSPPPQKKNYKNINLWNLYVLYSWLLQSSWNFSMTNLTNQAQTLLFVTALRLNWQWSNFPDHVWRFWAQTRSSRHVQGLMLGLVFVLFVYYRSSVVSETWRWLRIRGKKYLSRRDLQQTGCTSWCECVYLRTSYTMCKIWIGSF